MASFRAGTFDFVLLAAHVRWGKTVAGRTGELTALADWIVARTEEKFFGDRDILAVGEFNIGRLKAADWKVLADRGIALPPGLSDEVGTDLARKKRYDQILCLPRETACFSGRAGALDFYAGDHRPLFPGRRLTKDQFTFQLSDHLPLRVELLTRGTGEAFDLPVRGRAPV